MNCNTSTKYYLGLLQFSAQLGAEKIKTEEEYVQTAKTIAERRDEFGLAIRPLFLKFLPLIDEKSFKRIFTKEEQIQIQMGNVPENWSIHHQKPLFFDGASLNWLFEREIRKVELTPFQKKKVKKSKNPFLSVRAFKIENYLKNADEKGVLKDTFLNLFKGYLIILPKQLHNSLEKDYLHPQQTNAALETRSLSNKKKFQISYPVWNCLIFGGEKFIHEKAPKFLGIRHKRKQKFFDRAREASKTKSKADD